MTVREKRGYSKLKEVTHVIERNTEVISDEKKRKKTYAATE